MALIYFVYGLAFFSMGIIAALEARRSTKLPLGNHLGWLAGFGITHSLVEWTEMILFVQPHLALSILHTSMLPVSALLLGRFGLGLVRETGFSPARWNVLFLGLCIPVGLLVGFAMIQVDGAKESMLAIEVWSRYLIYFPANLLTAFGFARACSSLKSARLSKARNLLVWAALGFLVNALMAGLVVPQAPYGLAPWLNSTQVLQLTGIPVQLWRALSAVTVTLLVVRALSIFEVERGQQLAELEEANSAAQRSALAAQVKARDEAQNWNNALVQISRCIAEMDDLDDVLLKIIATARRLLQADVVVLGLWNQDRKHLGLKGYSTEQDERIAALEPIEDALLLETVTGCRSVCYRQECDSPAAPLTCVVLNQTVKNAVIVTLKLENQPFGAIWAGRIEQPCFTQNDVAGLEHLADQAVIAISHSFMAARLQSLAVMEERSRIAREMHDGLAQILGYLRLETQTLEALVLQGNQSLVISKLQQARQNIDLAHADVRENILSLRTTLSNEAGAIPALQEYAAEFGVQTGIHVYFENDIPHEINLSPMAETQMVRIIQEALANVRKHAHACKVMLHLQMLHDCLSVTVTDDGIGFKHTPGQRSFGLQTMRERAEGVGGGLTVTAQPDQGTQVHLWLPLLSNRSRN